MTIRAEQVWEAFCEEIRNADPLGNTRTYDVKTEDDVRTALSVAIRVVADRLCTDVGEMECFIEVVRKIADELEELK